MLNHVRVPEHDARVSVRHRFTVFYDPRKRRYYLYHVNRLCPELSFSESEFRSNSFIQRKISRWMSGMHDKYMRPETIDIEYMEKREEEKRADEMDKRVGYYAKEFVKYGVLGSQAPGPCSVVVDGNKK